jgi:long-chain acyl-CoA synthetase
MTTSLILALRIQSQQLLHVPPISHVSCTPQAVPVLLKALSSLTKTSSLQVVRLRWLIVVAGVDNAIAGESLGKLKLDQNDRFLCFLPLAHILEFVYELCAIHWGGTIGYGNPRTLTQDSVRNCQGDIHEFKPTILVAYVLSVPTEIVSPQSGKK